MADELESIASVELAEPAIEQQSDTAIDEPKDLNAPETEEVDEGDEEGDADLDDLEFGFDKFRVPKKLKEGVEKLRAAFTHSTQEVAQEKRALEAYQQRLVQQAQVSDAELNARAALVNVEARLKQFEQVDWDAWDDTDPVGASKGWREYQTLDKQRSQYVGAIQQTENLRTQAAQQDFAKRVEETEAFARKSIPNWTPEVDKTVLDFARKQGVSDEFMRQHMQPLLYDILHKASIGERVMLKQTATPRPAATPAAQPLQTVSAKSNAPARKTLSDMNMDEYVAARKAGRG